MIRLCSYDVWDTLLRRRCHPDAVKLHLSRYLLLQYHEQIATPLRDAQALLNLRLRVEHELAGEVRRDPGHDDEYRHADVLCRWLQRAFSSGTTRSELITVLADEEFAQERTVSYADANAMRELGQQSQARRIFISDFYMPAAKLAQLLDAKGYVGCFERGYSSADHLLNKRSGRLFALAQQQFNVKAAQHHHCGDDARSDVRVPRRLGMKALHHRHRAEERLRQMRHRAYADRASLSRQIQRLALGSEPPLDGRAQRAFRAGIELAPLFVGFGLFMLEEAQKQRLSRLYFLSREGAFFAGIYDRLRVSSERVARRTPAANVLQISRRASFAASLSAASIDEMQRLWRAYRPATMNAWALSLNLDPVAVQDWCAICGLQMDEPLAEPASDTRVQALFASTSRSEAILRAANVQKGDLLAYLRQQSVPDDSARIGVVDIGWRGTMQDHLALVLPQHHWSGLYLGLQRFLNPQPHNTAKCAYGPDLNLRSDGESLFKQLPLIEMLCTPPMLASVIGYARSPDGTMQAKFARHPTPDPIWLDVVQNFLAGVQHAASVWADEVHVQALGSEDLRADGLVRWQRLLERTPRPLREARDALPHDEQFGRGIDAPPPRPRRRWLR